MSLDPLDIVVNEETLWQAVSSRATDAVLNTTNSSVAAPVGGTGKIEGIWFALVTDVQLRAQP